MSSSANLVGAFFRWNKTASADTGAVELEGVSLVEENTECVEMKPAEDTRPAKMLLKAWYDGYYGEERWN
jgi:hypothetical protein